MPDGMPPPPRVRNGESTMAVLVPPLPRKPHRFWEYWAVAKSRGVTTPFQLPTASDCGVRREMSTRGSIDAETRPRTPVCSRSVSR